MRRSATGSCMAGQDTRIGIDLVGLPQSDLGAPWPARRSIPYPGDFPHARTTLLLPVRFHDRLARARDAGARGRHFTRAPDTASHAVDARHRLSFEGLD